MQNHPATPDDEITLFDLWQILVRRKWLVLATPLLAVIAAMVAVILIKPQWEATAAIRVGAVGQVGQVGQVGPAIEPVERAVERMKLKSFKDAVLSDLGYPLDEKNPEAGLYRGSLTAKALPNTDLIEISVRGYSRDGARRSAEVTVFYLQKIHDQLAAPTVQRLRQLLVQAEREITQAKAEREKVLKISGLKDEGGFMENVVLANIMIQRDGELRELEKTKMLYEEQLGPLRTYPTSLIERISVSENPVAPKKSLIILLVGIFGLVLGVMLAFLSNALQLNRRGGG
jgi:uncharacterized protein involved in exopolysaccharide biosynthesis